jgi:hypothetical protein
MIMLLQWDTTDRDQKLIKHMESIVIEKKIAEKKRRKQEQLSISDYLGVSVLKYSYGLVTHSAIGGQYKGIQRCQDDSRGQKVRKEKRLDDGVGERGNRVEMVRQILAVLLEKLCEGHGEYDTIGKSFPLWSS